MKNLRFLFVVAMFAASAAHGEVRLTVTGQIINGADGANLFGGGSLAGQTYSFTQVFDASPLNQYHQSFSGPVFWYEQEQLRSTGPLWLEATVNGASFSTLIAPLTNGEQWIAFNKSFICASETVCIPDALADMDDRVISHQSGIVGTDGLLSVDTSAGVGPDGFPSGSSGLNFFELDFNQAWTISGMGGASFFSFSRSGQMTVIEGENLTFSVQVTPIPEPETYAMLLAGLGILVLTRRKATSGA